MGLQSSIPPFTTRVARRLQSEGWVQCPGLGFAALCQNQLGDLRTFVLERLQQEDNWLWEVDLQLATLIFSISAHEFQFHPHLETVLKQLENQRIIEIQAFKRPAGQRQQPERAIFLKAANVA